MKRSSKLFALFVKIGLPQQFGRLKHELVQLMAGNGEAGSFIVLKTVKEPAQFFIDINTEKEKTHAESGQDKKSGENML